MSKNFELLQQVGNDEELFRRTAQPGDAIPVADVPMDREKPQMPGLEQNRK